MKVRKSLEKPTKVLGMSMMEIGIYVGVFLLLIVVVSFLRTFVPIPKWFNYIILAFVVGGWTLLRWGESKKHPSFLLSAISFFLLQPKKIVMNSPEKKNKNVFKKRS